MRCGVSAAGTGVLSAMALLASGCPPAGEDGPFTGQDIAWRACEDGARTPGPAGRGADPDWVEALECGTVTVPLDHDEPAGQTLDLALVRAPAGGPEEERLGSLVLNPGGPGIPGTGALDAPRFSDEVRAAFDLVSFDPRGVGRSGGFACGDPYALDDARRRVADTDPGDLDAVELQPLEDAARRYAQACRETVGEEFLANIGTVNVARDLDIVRDALGEERLNFVGYSYGTHIGALYAHMYPDNTRSLVLDGAVATEKSNAEAAVDQVAAFQNTWNLFVAHCAARDDACPFADRAGGSGKAVGEREADARMAGLLEELDREPAEAGGIPVDGRTLLTMITMELYHEDSWDYLADLLTALAADDAEASGRHLGRLYDNTFGGYEEADPGEVVPGAGHQDASAVFTAVNCADRDDPENVEAYRAAAEEAARVSPLFGPDPVWDQLPCAYWAETEEAPADPAAPEAPPVVVIGALADPATPHSWARDLSARLESAVLLTYEGGGHTVYGDGRSDCVDEAVDAYLLAGEVPGPGLTCPAAGP